MENTPSTPDAPGPIAKYTPPELQPQEARAAEPTPAWLPAGFTMVDSTNLAAVGFFDADMMDAGRLEVIFRSGHRWAYQGVTRAQYEALMAAESPGRHFAFHIRDDKKLGSQALQPAFEPPARPGKA